MARATRCRGRPDAGACHRHGGHEEDHPAWLVRWPEYAYAVEKEAETLLVGWVKATRLALLLAARQAGDAETVAVCGALLEQERAMADWLGEHPEPTVLQFLEREQSEDMVRR